MAINAASLGAAHPAPRPMSAEERKVIFASSLGTVFEWYDFYLYGSLAAIIAKQFFSGLDPQSAFIFALLAFAAGFIVRPFGALVFGRLGDMIGRKYTFLVTILIMGLSTFIVGILPTYASIGVAAPVILIALRMLQGLALGGEYGGAATYVAEHAPHGKRGAYTSWIQTTATLGLFLSLLVILGTRTVMGEDAFADWGWRIPFLVSILLLGVSVWIRLSLSESPAFQKMKAEGKTSKAPLSESFGQWKNLKIVHPGADRPDRRPGRGLVHGPVLCAVLPDAAAQGRRRHGQPDDRRGPADRHAVLRDLRHAVRQDRPQAHHHGRLPAGRAHLLPGVQGADRSRQPRPGPGASAPTRWWSWPTPGECSFQFNPTGTAKFTSSCDIAKQVLAAGLGQLRRARTRPPARLAVIKIGGVTIPSYASKGLAADEVKKKDAAFKKAVADTLKAAGYPTKADPAKMNKVMMIVHPDLPGDPGDHGLRPDRRHAGGDVPDAHPLHLDEPAVPHRQRLVRRPAAHHRRSPSWRRPATCTTACGTRSSLPA